MLDLHSPATYETSLSAALEIGNCLQGLSVLLLNHSLPNSIESPPPTEAEKPPVTCGFAYLRVLIEGLWNNPLSSTGLFTKSIFWCMAGHFELYWDHYKQNFSPTSAWVHSYDAERTLWLQLRLLQTIIGVTDAFPDYVPKMWDTAAAFMRICSRLLNQLSATARNNLYLLETEMMSLSNMLQWWWSLMPHMPMTATYHLKMSFFCQPPGLLIPH